MKGEKKKRERGMRKSTAKVPYGLYMSYICSRSLQFIVGAFNEGHEGTGEVIGLVDDDLVEFLGEINYNNTAVFIVSDHGLHMNIMFAFREQSVIKV